MMLGKPITLIDMESVVSHLALLSKRRLSQIVQLCCMFISIIVSSHCLVPGAIVDRNVSVVCSSQERPPAFILIVSWFILGVTAFQTHGLRRTTKTNGAKRSLSNNETKQKYHGFSRSVFFLIKGFRIL